MMFRALLAPRVMVTGAIVLIAACAGRSDVDADAADQRATAAERASAAEIAPPLGEYALATDIAIVIARDTGGAGQLTFRIGEGTPHPMVASSDGWEVPTLGMELEPGQDDGARGLWLHRYGESVFVRPAGTPHAGMPRRTEDALTWLTPRLMIALDVPGVGIALVRGGTIAWRGSFGVKRSGEDAPVDSTTVFEAASMSKPAYTYPFMKLVEDGVIDLDTPLVEYLGRDYLEGDTLHRAITARMVLSHTTGFPNWRDDDGLTVEFVPGTQIGYSGEGFEYLQKVAEVVTGLPMATFTQQRFFDPLGLGSASYVWRDVYDATMAYGHTEDGEPRERRPYPEPSAAYTLYVTPADYARILIEIMRDDRSAPHSLSDATVAIMLEPQHVAPDREPIRRGGRAEGAVHFALGWRLDRTASGDRYWHSGSNSTGFQCYAEFDPATGDGIVIMTNSSSGSPLWRALMDATGQP